MERPGNRYTRMSHGRSLAVLVLACPVLLAGCSGGGVRDSVAKAVEQGSSSVSTARLAAELGASGSLTTAATSTALEDALKELGKTRTTVVELSAAEEKDRDLRHEALAVLDACVSAVSGVADAVSSQDGQAPTSEEDRLLESVAGRLADLKSRVGSK